MKFVLQSLAAGSAIAVTVCSGSAGAQVLRVTYSSACDDGIIPNGTELAAVDYGCQPGAPGVDYMPYLPTVNSGGPYIVEEGSSLVLDWTGTDTGNEFVYAWDLDGSRGADDGIYAPESQPDSWYDLTLTGTTTTTILWSTLVAHGIDSEGSYDIYFRTLDTTVVNPDSRDLQFFTWESVSVEVVPEPTSLALLGLGGLGLLRRRRSEVR